MKRIICTLLWILFIFAGYSQIGVFKSVITDTVKAKDYRFQQLPNYSVYGALTNITTGGYDLTTPPGTTAQRPTVPSGKIVLRFNTDSNALEYGNSAGVWKILGTSTVQTIDTSSISNFGLKVKSQFSGTSPILYNGITGNISIQQSSSSQAGYLSQADWIAFNAKLGDPGSNGFLVRTAPGTTASRSFIAASNNVSIVNPTGVSGNPSFDINDTLFLRQISLSSVPAMAPDADSVVVLNRTTGLFEIHPVAAGGGGSGTFNKAGGGISSSGDSLFLNQSFTRGLFSGVSPISYNSSTGAISLTTVPISLGGTNSAAPLNNNRLMQSSGGAIIEAPAITANRALISDANGIPTHSAVTNTELGYLSGVSSSVQTQLNSKLTNITGLITEGTNVNITGTGTSLDPYIINSTGGGGGSPAGSSNQIQVNISGSFAAEAGFEYDFTHNKFTADSIKGVQFLGDSARFTEKIIISPDSKSYAEVWGVGELGPAIYIHKNIGDDGSPVNEHGIIDGTLFSREGKSYASVDIQTIFMGDHNHNHFAGAQLRPDFQGSGTVDNAYMMYTVPSISGSKTITNLYHFSVNPPEGAHTINGAITNEHGYYCGPLAGSNKWAVYVYQDKSYFGGNVGIGTATATAPAYPLTVNTDGITITGNWRNLAQFVNDAGTAGINIGWDDSGNNFGVISSQGSNSGFHFRTNDGVTGFKIAATFAPSGNFGINTESPGRLLTINSTSVPTFGLSVNDVEKALMGSVSIADQGIAGSVANDWFLRTTGGDMLFSTDNGMTAHFIIRDTGVTVNGKMNISVVDSSIASAPHVLYQDPSGQIKKAAFGAATTLYTGDGTVGTNRTVNLNGTINFSGAINSDTAISITNNGTTGTGLFVYGTTLGTNIQSPGTAINAFGTVGGMQITSSTNEAIIAQSNGTRAIKAITSVASDNTVEEVLSLQRSVNPGVGANGIGSALTLTAENTSGAQVLTAQLVGKLTTATNGAEVSQVALVGTNSSATTTLMQFDGTALKLNAYTGGVTGTPTTALYTTSSGDVIQGTILNATSTLDFGSTATGTSTDLTITVTGAAVGDLVYLGVPNGSVPTAGSFMAWVSATNTVTVRFTNPNALAMDPSSGSFKVRVIK